jgi:phosphoribosyl-ATP pyrophosphohydrolase
MTRIKQLIKTKSNILFPGTDTVDCQISDIEKFAQLIIDECIEVAMGAKSKEAAAMIVMHFGVGK